MSDIRKYFTIMKNDAGSEAYRDSYVHELERSLAAKDKEIAELKSSVAALAREANHEEESKIYNAELVAERDKEIAGLKKLKESDDYILRHEVETVAALKTELEEEKRKHMRTMEKRYRDEQEIVRLQGLVERAKVFVEHCHRNTVSKDTERCCEEWLKDAEVGK